MSQEKKPVEPIRPPTKFPDLGRRSKETPELRFSPNYSDGWYDNAWEWFQDAMAEDEGDTLQSLGELFTVSLRPIYRGVVAKPVLTAEQYEEKLFYKPEKASRDVFYEWVEKRRQSALKTVGKYSSTVILLGFLNPGAIHYGARTDIPYSALILLLHKLGFDPLKPFRNKDIKDKFQRKLGEIIVKKTAEALRAKRRVVLKPYIKRVAEEAVELVKDYIFGAVLPTLKPGLEQSTMRARRYNKSHWLASYEGKREIDEPMYETGRMCEEVSYTLNVPDGDISRMLDELYNIEEMEQRTRKEVLEAERRARAKKIDKWMKKRRAWQREARKIHAKRTGKALPEKEKAKTKKQLLTYDEEAEAELKKKPSKSGSTPIQAFLDAVGKEKERFEIGIRYADDLATKKKRVFNYVNDMCMFFRTSATHAKGIVKDVVVDKKTDEYRIIMEEGHTEEELNEEQRSAITKVAGWVIEALKMFKGLGK